MRNSPRCQPFVLQAGECLRPTALTPLVLNRDGSHQCGGETVVEVLRRTDLGQMHADLPMDGQTMRLVCNVALAGLKRLSREPHEFCQRSAQDQMFLRRQLQAAGRGMQTEFSPQRPEHLFVQLANVIVSVRYVQHGSPI